MSGRRLVGGLLALVAGIGAAGCAATSPPAPPSLYQRLGQGTTGGGREKIAMIVTDFVAGAVADDRISGRFKGLTPAAVEKLKSNLADQICEAAGGPCAYLGREMKEAHRGLNISETEWNATVEALVKALDKQRVAEREKGELLSLLGPMKKDIVGQ